MTHDVREESKVTYWYNINVMDKRDCIVYMSWTNMPIHTRLQFDWYFKYRAALLQVKYPRLSVYCHWGSQEPEGDLAKKMARNRVIAKKRKLTELKNKIQEAVRTWNELMPIEQHPKWCEVMAKQKRVEQELEDAIKEQEMEDTK